MKHIESSKLGIKSDICLFMEYPKGYNLYHSSKQNCLFQSMQLSQRNSFSYRKQWEYKLELNEVQDPQIEADEPIKPTTVELVDSTYEPPVIQAPRKSVMCKVRCLGLCYQGKVFASRCYLYIPFNILSNFILSYL